MESVLGRYRNLIILVGVLFLQVLGLAVQVKRGSSDVEDTRLIRLWAVSAVTPFERVLVWAQNSTGNLWRDYFYLRGVRTENRQLKEQIEQMRLEQVRLSEDASQAHRLQALLAFKEQFISKTVAAQVIGTSGSDSSRVIYIDKGDDYHVSRDMAVITADGIVGKVLEVFPSVSKVLLINDLSSGVGVILGNSRLQGVLAGTSNGEVVLTGVMSDEQVPVGEAVLTSGGDQIFPKGLPVGTVARVSEGKDLFLNIKVKPAADLSKLEEVLVLAEKQEKQATAENAGRVRAADILAQRLPSVPEKPAPIPNPNAAAASGTGSSRPVSSGTAGAKSTSPTLPSASQAGKHLPATVNQQITPPGKTPATGTDATPTKQKATTPAHGLNAPKAPGAQSPPADAPPKPSAPATNVQPPADEGSPN